MSTLYGIDIEGTSGYEQTTEKVLKQIGGTRVGQVILNAMKATDKDLTIVPYDKGKAAAYGKCNSTAKADDPNDATPQGLKGGRKGSPWFRGRADDPRTTQDERYDQPDWKSGEGTGEGSDVRIYYSSDIWGASGCGGGNYGSLPDEALCHEMVHALRQMQGLRNPYPSVDALRDYDNDEEFLAIVVTNVYISAKGSTQLRADHAGFTQLRSPLNTSAGFLANPDILRLMSIYRLSWSSVFGALSRLSAVPVIAFNPFRQLTNNLAHYGPVS